MAPSFLARHRRPRDATRSGWAAARRIALGGVLAALLLALLAAAGHFLLMFLVLD